MKTLSRASLFTLVAVASVPCAYGRGRASGYCQQGGQTVQVLGYQSSATTPVQGGYTGSGCNVLVLYSNGGGTTATGPSGIINTSSSGNTITWLSGNVFNANGQWSGLTITIASVPYTISSCSNVTTCTLTSSPGNQTSVAYSMSAATPAAIFADNAGTAKSNPFAVSSTGYWFYYADNGSYANQYSGTAISSTYTNAALPLSDPSNLPNVIRWNATLGTTFAQQCAAATAAPNTAIVIDTVAPVPAGFTASCPVIMYPGGLIQPANGQTVKITGSFSSPDSKTLDTSIAGSGSIVFGSTSLVNEQVVPHAEWFGASPSATAAANTLALQSAAYAFPSGSGYVQGAIPIRQGAFTVGCGAFQVNAQTNSAGAVAALFMNAGDRFYSTCTTSSTLIQLANSQFTGSETFMIRVLPSCFDGIACSDIRPNITQNVNIENIALDCNGANNSGCSGILFYGAETSKIAKDIVGNYSYRGIAIGNYSAVDSFFGNDSDAIRLEDVWITGILGTSRGPGLYVHANGVNFENVQVQHANTFGTYTNTLTGTAQPNAEWMIDTSEHLLIDRSSGEFDQRGMEIYNSFDIQARGYNPGTCASGDVTDCNSVQGAIAVRGSGSAGAVKIQGATS